MDRDAQPSEDLLARFLPHFLHELGNAHVLARGNVDLEIEIGSGSDALRGAAAGLDRAGALCDQLRLLLRPIREGEVWDLGEATEGTLDLLRCACRDGALEVSLEPPKTLPPREGDRRGYCQALLLLGLEGAESNRHAPAGERVLAVRIESTANPEAACVRLKGLEVSAEALAEAGRRLASAGGALRREGAEVLLCLDP